MALMVMLWFNWIQFLLLQIQRFCGDIVVRYWKLKLSLKSKGSICYFGAIHRILYFTQWLPNWQGRLRQTRLSGCVWKGPDLMPAGSINCWKSWSRSIMGFLYKQYKESLYNGVSRGTCSCLTAKNLKQWVKESLRSKFHLFQLCSKKKYSFVHLLHFLE